MNATNLLHNFQEIGVRFEVDGGGFRVLALPGVVTLEMRQLLKDHKEELVNLLQQTEGEDSEIVWRIEAMRLQLADEGVPLTAIAKVMGHASTQTTEKYAHATDEGTRRAVEALQKKPPLVTNWSQRERKEGIA